MRANPWLVAGGVLSAAAALLHLAIIAGGPSWYRFFGAGERMARAAAYGSVRPTLYAVAIATILAIWSAYAFSGAGLIGRLPLLRTALVLISFVYLARALAPLPILLFAPERMNPFVWWSSGIVLLYGVAYAIGTWTGWRDLAPRLG
jgi:hypothetical protein